MFLLGGFDCLKLLKVIVCLFHFFKHSLVPWDFAGTFTPDYLTAMLAPAQILMYLVDCARSPEPFSDFLKLQREVEAGASFTPGRARRATVGRRFYFVLFC